MHLRKSLLTRCLLGATIFLAFNAGAHAAQPLNSMHWTAQWIWPSINAIAPHRNQFILFRKTFTLSQTPQHAQLAIFADSRYRLFVNGAYIGQGPARAPHYWSYYDTFEVAPKLRAGLNVIAVEVRWYGQGLAWYIPPPAPINHGALLCQLAIGDGAQRQIIKSDASWKAMEDHAWDWNTPQVNNSLANIEVYHSDRMVKGWTEAQFDDSNWVPVSVLTSYWGLSSPPEEPYTHLVLRPIAYPVEREITPAKVVSAGLFPSRVQRTFFFRGRNPLSTLGAEIASEKHTTEASILSNPEALTT
ncbi:MAG: alpha-L-rhamnosidase N-terminal domain-containing protein, partial [Terriglobia bacterium]